MLKKFYLTIISMMIFITVLKKGKFSSM